MSRLILAVETTHEHGSLALLRDEQLLEELPMHAPTGFAHVLYRHLADLFRRHRLKVDAVDCFAAAAGPGSFTGVRVGLSCVMGLAEALGKRAVAVSNLQALASFGSAPLRAVVLDARRSEIYGAVYDAAARLVSPEVVAPFGAWLAALPCTGLEFVSPDFTAFRPLVAGTLFENVPVCTAPLALAAAVARLAAQAAPQDPAFLDANYVRRSDAELLWKE